MRTLILSAFAAISLGISAASAASTSQATPQPNESQFETTAGAPGWG